MNAEKKLKQIFSVEAAKIFLVNKEKNVLWRINDTREVEEYPINCGIVGKVIETGELESITNPYNHFLFNRKIDIETSMPLICMPIRSLLHSGNDVLGAFQVINVKGIEGLAVTGKAKLTDIDLEILDFTSKQLAQCIINNAEWAKTTPGISGLEKND